MKTIKLSTEAIDTGNLILVNYTHRLQYSLKKSMLTTVNTTDSDVLLERHTSALLTELMTEIDGWKQIAAVSGWRSKQEQEALYSQSLQDNGAVFTEKFVASPDCSEHQTGMAIDLGIRCPEIDFIRPDFPYSGICQVFREKAPEYGFVERYSQGKENITKIAHEPWHFRYVGTPHAAIMTELGLSLEEYHDFIRQYRYGDRNYIYQDKNNVVEICFLPAEIGTETSFTIEQNAAYSISGNNSDGYILTVWRHCHGTR